MTNCQAQFQLTSPVQVQLRTETPPHPVMVIECLDAIESDFGWPGIARGACDGLYKNISAYPLLSWTTLDNIEVYMIS